MTHAIELMKRLKPKRNSFESFVFINDLSLKSDPRLRQQLHRNPNSNLLSQSELGCQLKVQQIYAPPNIIRQLDNVHFQASAQIKLVSKTHQNSVIVELQGKLIGLGAEIARTIVVTAVNEPKL